LAPFVAPSGDHQIVKQRSHPISLRHLNWIHETDCEKILPFESTGRICDVSL